MQQSISSEAQAILDGKTKPQGSLGGIEAWAVKCDARMIVVNITTAQSDIKMLQLNSNSLECLVKRRLPALKC